MWYVGGNPKISEGIRNLYAEIEHQSDRAIGILAGSIVETHLTDFLEHSIQHDGDMWKRRSHSSAPLGSFAVKIDLLYMFRLITKEARSDLIQMKDIRNRFAHLLDINEFSAPEITNKCNNLQLVERYVVESDAISSMSTTHLAGKSTFQIGGRGALDELKSPRLRYVWSARVFSMAFGNYYGWPPPII